ncbi:MAG: GPR endopeptidase [Agathobacter sp.]
MRVEEYPIRTDLALETQEKIQKDEGELKGVDFYQEDRGNGITVSTLIILTENAAKNMGRPRGHYITIEAPEMVEDDESGHREISLELADILRDLIIKKLEKIGKHVQTDKKRQKKASEDESGLEKMSILLVGLGNREVTPDALGPRVIDNMFITRHIIKEYGKYAFGDEKISKISGIVPGVMAQTGMECLEIVRGVVKETGPDVVITVDALAARNAKRLGRTIQLTDTGITPGSGVGNHRNALNEKSVGVPVISLGVPTVVDAATIVSDAMSSLVEAMSISNIEKLDEKERQELARELLSPQLNGMFVTPKDIDDSIKRLSFLISEGINIALLGNKDVDTNIK